MRYSEQPDPNAVYASFGTFGGGVVKRGSIVNYYRNGVWNEGVVVHIQAVNAFSEAYGREAVVRDKRTDKDVEISVKDMEVIGEANEYPEYRYEDRDRNFTVRLR